MERISRFRAVILLLIFSLVLGLYSMKLFDLQIIEAEGKDNTTLYSTITTVRAARGDILDRNGKVLVGNRASYDLVFNHYVIKSTKHPNDHLLRLYHKCQELGIEYLDHFPVTKQRPFEYTLAEATPAWQHHFQNFMVDRGLDPDVTAPLLLERLKDRYDIPGEWSDEEARAVIGMRYEFDLRGVTNLPNYVFIEDVSDEDLSALLELNIPGLIVESSTVREYHTKYAAHILGYMGGMDADDWKKYKDQGYSMDAYIGQAGFEEAFEEYLHGIDGLRWDAVSRDGTIVKSKYTKDPIAGNNVETTIDLDLQIVAEDALEELMTSMTDPQINQDKAGVGLDAEGAAVVVMNVKTGEILACASYPTYDLSTMHEKWDEIDSDPLKPFFNRAFGAYYAPGSSYKPCTLVAAMEHGRFDYGETIVDEGVFTKYAGFSPKCMLYANQHITHGELDAPTALEVSCNYFFYELGDRLKIEELDETAKALGLGEPTGIELTEKIGWRSNPESKKASYKGLNQQWFVGDKILTAIGQAENRFTPLQLAVYASTLANQGVRYKATFLNRVVSSDYRTLIFENKPEIANKMDISWQTYETYTQGMRQAVTSWRGTSRKYFGGFEDPQGRGNFPVEVCAKTGTAQHSSGGSDHAAFICFAPMGDPEIAIAAFGEKAAHGGWMGHVPEVIMESYFDRKASSDVYTYENQIG